MKHSDLRENIKMTMDVEAKHEEETDDAIFEKIMSHVDMRGPFQRRFNIIFNMLYVLLVAMPYFNIVMILAIPDHWCNVPGRDQTNFTLEDWKVRTLPRSNDENGNSVFSKCMMYNTTVSAVLTSSMLTEVNGSNQTLETVKCKTGWDYDDTYYISTAASQEDWVCDNEILGANVMAFSRIGDVIGTFVMGQLGDIIGRRPVFFISIAMLVSGRLISALTAHYYSVFLAATVFASIPVTAAFQSPLILGIEVSANDERSNIAMLQCLGWTAGLCIMPFAYWAVGDWRIFLFITTLPTLFYLFTCRLFPESPRWLAATGRTSKCVKSLRKIAKANNRTLPLDATLLIQKLSAKKESAYGLASLFSSWRLAKNTILISTCWVIGSLMYYTLMLNITNLSGNPYMNFFWQALVELPGYILGKYLSETIGRRWTQAGVFLITALAHIIILFIAHEPHLTWLMTATVVFIKLGVTISGYAAYLQAIETFPTCVRQTGCATGSLLASAFGVVGPYIIYLGTVSDIRYSYVIMGLLTLLGAIAASFLPETMNQKLPETLKESSTFGKNQKFWRIYQESEIIKEKSSVPLK